MADDDHRRRCPSEDRLSSLPDELLHVIILRLGSTCAAARTSVLSRRWRHRWADVPEIVLVRGTDAPPASFHDVVDAAHAASTLERLLICVSDASEAITSGRAAPWLRIAAERVAGALLLLVPPRLSSLPPVAVQELELPACVRAKTITFKLQDTWLLRPAPAGGVFTALTALTILYGSMEGSELTALVSTRCPCLKDVRLRLTLVDASDVSIRSDTLRSLWFCINSPLIEVVAPRLEKLCVYYAFKAHFLVPMLSELVWIGDYANDSHQFANVSRSLQLLHIRRDQRWAPTSLLEKFSQVDELNLIICIPRVHWEQQGMKAS
ncbi:probable FBD-associated F-box protein At1g32375 isoform X2 [Miscanthus floridulus]|uniref:probable FBD-associated F-box protein At1g32375 isoform X2 n=1 Tax=Miscanthus floridulus TaxID=154761 RepID=UPI00345A97F7